MCGGIRFSNTGVAGFVADSSRGCEYIQTSGVVDWSTRSGSGGRHCDRAKSDSGSNTLPPSDSRKRRFGRISVGVAAKAGFDWEGECCSIMVIEFMQN